VQDQKELVSDLKMTNETLDVTNLRPTHADKRRARRERLKSHLLSKGVTLNDMNKRHNANKFEVERELSRTSPTLNGQQSDSSVANKLPSNIE